MRLRMLSLFLLLALALTLVGAALAQDEEEGDDDGLYSEVPTNRAEDGAFVLGEPDAPVTVIEFADYLCGHCQTYHETMTTFIEEYVLTGQAKFEYRFFPVIDQRLSPLMANTAQCAADQDAFWEAHSELYAMAREGAVDPELPTVLAERVGLDEEALSECVNGDGPFQYQEDSAYGSNLGVSGTPAVRVRVDGGDAGVLTIDGNTFNRGGAPLDALSQFVESETPSELVTYPNRLLNDDLLADTSVVEEQDGCDGQPCWRGIAPGETSFDEAVSILEEQDDVTNVNVQEGNGQRLASFAGEAGTNCCQMLSQDGEEVTFLQIRTAPLVSLSELVDFHGEPQYLTGQQISRSQSLFNIYYPDKGLMAFVFTPGTDAALNDDSEVIGSVYIKGALMEQIMNNSPMHEWEGYASLDEYNAGEYELNPEAGQSGQ